MGVKSDAGIVSRMFRIKQLDAILREAEEPEHQLKRALGPWQLMLFGVGAIIGAGIFATIGTAAAGDTQRPGAGPALIVSFIITAIVCSFTALCYAEFASMVPIAGSAYTYSYATLGELIAWIIGWDLIIEYAVGNIGVAISWANYFKTFVEGFTRNGESLIKIPAWMSLDLVTAYDKPQLLAGGPELFGRYVVINLLAIGITAALTFILIWGVKESARFNAIMVGIKVLVLLYFIAIGYTWIKPENWTPFKPQGWSGISAAAAVVFFAYIGFDAVSTVAEETRNPQRNLPIGIIGSLVVCTILYVVVAWVFTGLISFNDLSAAVKAEQAEPLTLALKRAGGGSTLADVSVGIVAFGSVIAHTAVLLVYQLGQTRIFFSMARDGLLPQFFCKLHPRFRTPYLSTLLIGAVVAIFATMASIDAMVDLTNIGTLFAFILVCVGIIVMRVKYPDRPRPFRVPSGWLVAGILYLGYAAGVWLLLSEPDQTVTQLQLGVLAIGAVLFALCRNYIFPVLGIISCLYLVYYLPPTSWLRFAAWLNLGFVVYIGYGVVHSRLTGRRYTDQPALHDASTAYTGAWLAIAGVVMLVLTRAFDVLQESYKASVTSHADWTWLARMQHGLTDVFTANAWLERSWFLLVPLAINAFFLCPLVFHRARSAMAAGAEGTRGRIRASLLLSGSLLAAIVVYFGLVALHKAPEKSEAKPVTRIVHAVPRDSLRS
jgi:basic amino acid/polyamine antiporter, APA family